MDINRTTAFAYNADGKLLTLTVQYAITGDQVTRFDYGTALAESGAASRQRSEAEGMRNGFCLYLYQFADGHWKQVKWFPYAVD